MVDMITAHNAADILSTTILRGRTNAKCDQKVTNSLCAQQAPASCPPAPVHCRYSTCCQSTRNVRTMVAR